MNAAENAHVSNFTVWLWLTGLVALTLVAAAAGLSMMATIVVVFSLSLVKAALVGWNYMHLRDEGALIWSLVLVPLVLAIGMTITFVPDIVNGR